MVDFLRKRLQVFVSSTYSDLLTERQAAVEAILTAGHIPAGMELFTAGDESQMDVIKQWIDESDVYLLILGGRYGSIEKTSGKSYVHLEYDYAVAKAKPLFSCVITDDAIESHVKMHGTSSIETDNPGLLKQFRADVLTRMVRFWKDSKDIKIAISETLSHFARRDDLTGWVRPTEEANMPALADEIARLSKENAQLRDQVASQQTEPTMHGLTFSEAKALLENRALLNPLIEHAAVLGTGQGNFSRSELEGSDMEELIQLGFAEQYDVRGPDGRTYRRQRLTPEGRAFLNRFELAKIDHPGDE